MYPSVLRPVEANEKEKHNNENHDMKLGVIIAISALSVFAFLAIVVMLVFLACKWKRSAGTHGGVDGDAEGERLHEPNDGEECFQANDAEEPVAGQETRLPVQATRSDIRTGG